MPTVKELMEAEKKRTRTAKRQLERDQRARQREAQLTKQESTRDARGAVDSSGPGKEGEPGSQVSSISVAAKAAAARRKLAKSANAKVPLGELKVAQPMGDDWDYATIFARTKSHSRTREMLKRKQQDIKVGEQMAAHRIVEEKLLRTDAEMRYRRLGTQGTATLPRTGLTKPPEVGRAMASKLPHEVSISPPRPPSTGSGRALSIVREVGYGEAKSRQQSRESDAQASESMAASTARVQRLRARLGDTAAVGRLHLSGATSGWHSGGRRRFGSALSASPVLPPARKSRPYDDVVSGPRTRPLVRQLSSREAARQQVEAEEHIGIVRAAMRESFSTGTLDLYLKGLRDESLSFVGSTIFLQLGHLRDINLQGNDLSKMPPNVWEACHHSRSVRLSANRFTEIPYHVSTWARIEDFDASVNQISKISDSLGRLKTLRRVSLANNMLVLLPDAWGKNLRKLETLELQQNRLMRCPAGFTGMSSLRSLDISQNQMRTLGIIPEVSATWHVDRDFGPATDWREILDASSGKPVFYNRKKKMTRTRIPHAADMPERFRLPKHQRAADDPDALPDGWHYEFDSTRVVDNFVNKWTGAVLHQPPADLADKLHLNLESVKRGGNADADVSNTPRSLGSNAGVHHKLDKAAVAARRRKWLATNGEGEWQIEYDDDKECVVYKNVATNSKQFSLPADLDSWGALKSLTHLNVSRNRLFLLPSSIGECRKLKVINASRNQIREIGDNLFGLTALERLDISHNCLTTFPTMPCNLEKLYVQDNQLEELPRHVVTMTSLRELFLHRNNLKSLCGPLGTLENIEKIMLAGNPLERPTIKECMESTAAHILWLCRQILLDEEKGTPPKLERVAIGAGNELHTTEMTMKYTQKHAVTAALETGVIHIAWKGLRKIENDIIRHNTLRELRLPGNEITDIPNVMSNMTSLQTLLLSNNKIASLPKDLANMTALQGLWCENNQIATVPSRIAGLRSIVVLNLSGNRVDRLPSDIGSLLTLRELYLDNNLLERVPESIGHLEECRVLSLGSNFISKLPDSFYGLKNCQTLNVNRNCLKKLPDSIGHMPRLRILKAGANQIKALKPTLCMFDLTTSLRELWVDGNRLKGLPENFVKLRKLTVLRLDMNPARSPPPSVALKGIAELKVYFLQRRKRIDKLSKLLVRAGFEVDKTRLDPFAKRFLSGLTGFLTKKDVKDFDHKADAYCNGEFFRQEIDPKEMVAEITQLKYRRAQSLYKLVLNRLTKLFERIVRKKALAEDFFLKCTHFKFPGDEFATDCYAIHLEALYGGPNYPYRSIAERAGFPYPRDVVMDAAKQYHLPLEDGEDPNDAAVLKRISHCGVIPFNECGCLDYKGVPLIAKHEPCRQLAVLVRKREYSETVLNARRMEVKEINLARAFVRDQTLQFLSTPQGEHDLTLKVVELKKALKEERRKAKEQLKHFKAENKRLQAQLTTIVQNARAFYLDKPHKAFAFKSENAAVDALEAKEQEIQVNDRQVEKWDHQVETLREKSKMTAYEWERYALDTICAAAQEEETKKIVDRRRQGAVDMREPRLWDGIEGADFKEWQVEEGIISESDSDAESYRDPDSSEFSAGNTDPSDIEEDVVVVEAGEDDGGGDHEGGEATDADASGSATSDDDGSAVRSQVPSDDEAAPAREPDQLQVAMVKAILMAKKLKQKKQEAQSRFRDTAVGRQALVLHSQWKNSKAAERVKELKEAALESKAAERVRKQRDKMRALLFGDDEPEASSAGGAAGGGGVKELMQMIKEKREKEAQEAKAAAEADADDAAVRQVENDAALQAFEKGGIGADGRIIGIGEVEEKRRRESAAAGADGGDGNDADVDGEGEGGAGESKGVEDTAAGAGKRERRGSALEDLQDHRRRFETAQRSRRRRSAARRSSIASRSSRASAGGAADDAVSVASSYASSTHRRVSDARSRRDSGASRSRDRASRRRSNASSRRSRDASGDEQRGE